MTSRTRSPAPRPTPDAIPGKRELARLKLSPEVAYYLVSRGIPLPDCPPAVKTPEAGEVLRTARFDPARVDRVLAAFSRLRHTQGEWAGLPLRPDPWQMAYFIAPVFGWVRRDSRRRWVRVVREAYADLPRKNGKTTMCGGVAIYLTCADGEPGAQVLAAATTKDQAGYVFKPVRQLAESSPALRPHVKPYATKILHPASGSYFAVVSSVAEALHGANVHGAVIDELHVHDTPDLVEAIETGTGSRRQPLVVTITTADAGKPGTIYDRKRTFVEQLAKRLFKHPATYGVIWAADERDDPFCEPTWRKANPGYGISPTKEYLETEAAKARQSPAQLSSFLRLHLGIRTKQVTTYIPLSVWDDSAGMTDEKALHGRACHGGIDLSSVEDLTALCWHFPPADPDGEHLAVWRFWLPEDRLDLLAKRTAGEALVWVREGWLRLTEGNVIDDEAVIATVLADAGTFRVLTIGHDRWGAKTVARRLDEEGLTCVPVGQGYASLSDPTKTLLKLLLRKAYRHGGNPIMRWMVDNLAVRMDPAGNVKPDKEKARDKIDGVSAAVTAIREWMDTETAPPPATSQSPPAAAGERELWRPTKRLGI